MFEAQPMMLSHANMVGEAALTRLEKEHGPLLETCELGQQCRTERKKVLLTSLQSEWESVIKSFKTDVEAMYLKTEKKIEEGYFDAVECQIDFPCCTVPETTFRNLWPVLQDYKWKITTTMLEIEELEMRKLAIETECPDE